MHRVTGAILSVVAEDFWSSYEGRTVDALAREGDEGRDKLR